MTGQERPKNREFKPRKDFKRDSGRSTYREKKEAQKVSTDWVETYLKEVSAIPVPDDWIAAAKYHLKWIGREVKNIQVHRWKALHADTEVRTVDQASLWCSAVVDGKPVCATLHLAGPDVKCELTPGTAKENKAPF